MLNRLISLVFLLSFLNVNAAYSESDFLLPLEKPSIFKKTIEINIPVPKPFVKKKEKKEPAKVVEDLVREVQKIKEDKILIDGQEINEVLTVNGVRFSFSDGSWGLIRASSNKPSLVVVTESPTSDERKKKIFDFIDSLLQQTGKIGEYDQKI